MATKYTISSALAYIAITGTKRGLSINTRLAVDEFVTFQCEDLNKPTYGLTPEGLELAKTSRLWKAHECLLGMGYYLRVGRRPKPGLLTYETEDGQVGFTGKHGRVYASNPEFKHLCKFITQFKNG